MSDVPLLEMVQPMPGFPAARQFALVQLDEGSPACDLRAVDDPDARFLVVPPDVFFPGYEPVIDDATVERLGIDSAEDVLVLVVVNVGGSLAESTANLRAPVVVNTTTRLVQQVVLDDVDLSLTTPLLAS
ncbi:flagellar assembly protein FliW [Nocardioides mangrovicus]|nr:flagellar assembly protein FliW [Nocardioides mangrovicus]